MRCHVRCRPVRPDRDEDGLTDSVRSRSTKSAEDRDSSPTRHYRSYGPSLCLGVSQRSVESGRQRSCRWPWRPRRSSSCLRGEGARVASRHWPMHAVSGHVVRRPDMMHGRSSPLVEVSASEARASVVCAMGEIDITFRRLLRGLPRPILRLAFPRRRIERRPVGVGDLVGG